MVIKYTALDTTIPINLDVTGVAFILKKNPIIWTFTPRKSLLLLDNVLKCAYNIYINWENL